MAWEQKHKVHSVSGSVTMTPGYYTETITLADDADASTSYLPFPIKSDFTMLVTWGSDLGADTYVRVEHSIDGSTWYKVGLIEEDSTVDHDDISKDISIIAAIDDNLVGTTCMMLYDIDTHGKAPYVRFTVSANGEDESSNTAAFTLIPHF